MDTKKLAALAAAVRLGSFTRAAEELGYTQSGLTHMMNSLEKDVGFPLLVRGRTGVRLTPAGQRIFPLVQECLNGAKALEREILLINTPRDYYLPLARNGEMDKLTHAGMYGVQESMAVLDNLYGTETAYYGRINFWGLIDIVDALGGIDVYSDFAFTTPSYDVKGYSEVMCKFVQGWNHMNGLEALTFSRERYAFSDGDNQRGKNQMKVIQAIIEKAASPSVLANYQDLLKAMSDNFITNISYDQISSLVQMMQKDGTS